MRIPWPMQENFTNLRQRAALEHPAFSANLRLFRAPEECLAEILDCRMIHGLLWVLQETFFESQLSSRIHGIWHHFLAD